MFKRLFIDHPEKLGESYGEHFGHAASFGAAMLVGSLACFLHALVPALCERTGSDLIRRLHGRMVVNRSNLMSPSESGHVAPGGSFI